MTNEKRADRTFLNVLESLFIFLPNREYCMLS